MRRSKDDSELTRTAILDAAELAFCDHGFACTTLETISRAAGVTRGAFYWHFKDKAEVLQALHMRTFLPQEQILAAAVDVETGDPLQFLLDLGIDALREFETDESRQRMFRIMSDLTAAPEGRETLAKLDTDMRHLMRRIMDRARAEGVLHPDYSPEEAAVFVVVVFTGLLSEWIRSGKGFPLSGYGGKLLRRQLAEMRSDAGQGGAGQGSLHQPTPQRPRSSPPGRAGPNEKD